MSAPSQEGCLEVAVFPEQLSSPGKKKFKRLLE